MNESQLHIEFRQFEDSEHNALRHLTKKDFISQKTRIAESLWTIDVLQTESQDAFSTRSQIKLSAQLIEGKLPTSNVGLVLDFPEWEKENYLLMPGCAYNGNRFESRRIAYSPKLTDSKDIQKNTPIIVSDVPRLNIDAGISLIQERSGALSIPAIGFYDPKSHTSTWIHLTQKNEWGDFGIRIEENAERNHLSIGIYSPLVREKTYYKITNNQVPSVDHAADLESGDLLEIELTTRSVPCESVIELFHQLNQLSDRTKPSRNDSFLLSSCFETIETKYNKDNFQPTQGYYAVGMRNGKYPFLQDWQIGWTGGMIATLPLLKEGSSLSQQRVIQNFNWLFPNGISPSGLFWDSGELKEDGFHWYGGDIRREHTKNWHLIRKSGDAVFYIIRQFQIMQSLGIPLKESWLAGIQKVCDTLVKIWTDNHQFGQFVDSLTGKIAVGNSTSGAIIPGALALASSFFKNDTYLKTAKESGEYYYSHFVKKGLLCGGPGDALQNPDSESAYALLESYVTLFEITGEERFLHFAKDTSAQFASWVMDYDYAFPAQSLLNKVGIKTTGSVFANTQNKHGEPGICLHSGSALLRLYRATGDLTYLYLLRQITQHIPQNLSHPTKPIEGMPIGWVSERVSTTDWLEGIGELMYGSTWAEATLMLTYAEIPGVYLDLQAGVAIAFDQAQVEVLENTKEALKISITNTSKTEGQVKVMAEKNTAAKWQDSYNKNVEKISLAMDETKVLSYEK